MQNNRKLKPRGIKSQLFRIALQLKKRKLYLTIGFSQFKQIKKLTHSKKQPMTPYTDWINKELVKVTPVSNLSRIRDFFKI